MPIDYSLETTPSFRDLTRSSLILLRTLRRLRKGQAVPEGPLVRTAKPFAGVR